MLLRVDFSFWMNLIELDVSKCECKRTSLLKWFGQSLANCLKGQSRRDCALDDDLVRIVVLFLKMWFLFCMVENMVYQLYKNFLRRVYHIKFLYMTYVVNNSLLKKVSVYLHIKIIFCIFVKRYKNNLKIFNLWYF